MLKGLLILLPLAILLALQDSSPSSAAHNTFILPFDAGLTFRVCRGYESGSGTSHYQTFALDLTTGTDPCNTIVTGGKTVRAPFTGTVKNVVPSRGEVCLQSADGIWMRLVHINYEGYVADEQKVSRGQVIGTVAKAGYKGNGGTAHLHIENYIAGTTNCYDPNRDRDRPFDSANGTALSGYSLPDDSIKNGSSDSRGQYYNKALYRQPGTFYDRVGASTGPKYTPALAASGGVMVANIPDLHVKYVDGIYWGDRIEAVRVGLGCTVTLYRHRSYSGASLRLTGSDLDLSNNYFYSINSAGSLVKLSWSNRASSAKISCK